MECFNMMKCIYQYHISGQNFAVEMPLNVTLKFETFSLANFIVIR